MSSKSKKGRGDRMTANRQGSSYKGNKQAQTQNYVKAQNRDFAKPQDSSVLEYSNSHVLDSIHHLVGLPVHVQTVDDQIYDGILDTISPEFKICLKNTHLLANANQSNQEYNVNPNKGELSNLIFELRNVLCIKCKNVDWDFPKKETFLTDSMISGANGPSSTGRELERWQAGQEDSFEHGELERPVNLSNGRDSYVDLMRANEEKFNYKSSFDKKSLGLYMDDIETHDSELYKMRSLEADQIVREIKNDDSHVFHDKLDSGSSEEEKFSSVRRSLTSANSLSGRNPNTPVHSRGRSRGLGFQSVKDHIGDPSDSMAGKYRKNNSLGGRRHESDEPPGPTMLYSQRVKASPTPDTSSQGRYAAPSQPPPPSLQQQQQQHMTYQQAASQQQNQVVQDEAPSQAPQYMAQQKSVGGHHHVPPRMLQHSAGNSRPQPVTKTGTQFGQSLASELDGEPKETSSGATAASTDKLSSPASVDEKPHGNETVKLLSEVPKNKLGEKVYRQKFGKIISPSPENPPHPVQSISSLKSFGDVKIAGVPQKRTKKPSEAQGSQSKEQKDADHEKMVIPVSPELAAKSDAAKGEVGKRDDACSTKTESHQIAEEKVDGKDKEKEISNKDEVTAGVGKAESETLPVKAGDESKVVSKGDEQKSVQTQQLETGSQKKGLNPNAADFVPHSVLASSPVPHVPGTSFSSVQAYQVTSPAMQSGGQSSLAGNRIPVIYGHNSRYRAGGAYGGYSMQQVVETSMASSAPVYQGGLVQQQQGAQQQQQYQQLFYFHPQTSQPGAMVQLPSQQAMLTCHVPQHSQVGQPQMMPPVYPEAPVYVVPSGSLIMQHQQQPQVQAVSMSHPSNPSNQSPQLHYLAVQPPQQYPPITSPLPSTPQGTPLSHGMQRPPTPSQHQIHPSATPPLHLGQQTAFSYGPNAVRNIQAQPFLAPQRTHGHLQTF